MPRLYQCSNFIVIAFAILYSLMLPAYAGVDTKILAFEQITNPDTNQSSLGTINLKDFNPVLPIWVGLYYVGIKENDDRETYNHLNIYTEGLEVPDNTREFKLVSDSLPSRENFQLEDNDEVSELIEDSLDQKIKAIVPAPDFNPKKIRVYGTVIDFIQDINNQGNITLEMVNEESHGLRPLGIYMIVGQGDKPEAIMSIPTNPVNLEGDGMPDKRWRKYGVIDPISSFMIFVVIAIGLIYIKRKN